MTRGSASCLVTFARKARQAAVVPFLLCAMYGQQHNLVLKIASVETGIDPGKDLVALAASVPRQSPTQQAPRRTDGQPRSTVSGETCDPVGTQRKDIAVCKAQFEVVAGIAQRTEWWSGGTVFGYADNLARLNMKQ